MNVRMRIPGCPYKVYIACSDAAVTELKSSKKKRLWFRDTVMESIAQGCAKVPEGPERIKRWGEAWRWRAKQLGMDT